MLAIVPLLLLFGTAAFAQGATAGDITAPLDKIYDLAKQVVSILGILAITIAGAIYMFAGNNLQTREAAKSTVSYAVVGLMLVWIAPALVSFLTAP